MAEEKKIFTAEEVKYINKKLSFIVYDWVKYLVLNIIDEAKSNGIVNLYWNSSVSLAKHAPVENEDKKDALYERLPSQMGFVEKHVEFREYGIERLWYMQLNTVQSSSKKYIKQSGMVALEQIPPTFQGAAIGILKHRGPYTQDEMRTLDAVLQNKRRSNEMEKAFWYDSSKTYDGGGQEFIIGSDEKVFIQQLTKTTIEHIVQDDILLKFFHYIMSIPQHSFSPSMLSFALVAIINENTWLINEIQTDTLSHYKRISDKYFSNPEKDVDTKDSFKLTKETIIDRLRTGNKSVWIPKLEDETFLQGLIDNPNQLNSLPDNNQVNNAGGLDQWISNYRANNPIQQPLFNMAKYRMRKLIQGNC